MKQEKPRPKRSKLARKIQVDGLDYGFTVTTSHVVIRNPEGDTIRVEHDLITGKPGCQSLIREWGDCGCRLGPGDVTAYIQGTGF